MKAAERLEANEALATLEWIDRHATVRTQSSEEAARLEKGLEELRHFITKIVLRP